MKFIFKRFKHNPSVLARQVSYAWTISRDSSMSFSKGYTGGLLSHSFGHSVSWAWSQLKLYSVLGRFNPQNLSTPRI